MHDDFIGKRFGHLVVLESMGYSMNRRMQYLCRCDCGKEKRMDKYELLRQEDPSCGCMRKYNARKGKEKEKLKTEHLKLEDVLKQNVIITEKSIKGYAESLCNYCIHSAAPPSLQCIWDSSRAKILPDGAEVAVSDTKHLGRNGGEGVLVKVIGCPLYADVRLPENEKLLKEEREKNRHNMNNAASGVWHNINNCKNKNNDDWR